MSGRLLYRLAVVGPEESRVGTAHVHVHRGLFWAHTEKVRLREDGDAGVSLLSDAEPALHWCVSVLGSQRFVVGGCRGEVPATNVGRGVGRAQGRVSLVR